MRLVSTFVCLLSLFVTVSALELPTAKSAPTGNAQSDVASTSAARDPNAVSILAQTLGALDATNTAVADYSASGTITYYYSKANSPEAPVNIKARGLYQFRIDSTLAAGLRSWVVSNGRGLLREPDNKTSKIPFHNAINLGALTLPFLRLRAALADRSYTAQYRLVQLNGQNVHEITIQPNLPQKEDPDGTVGALQRGSFYVDPKTLTIVGVHDVTHPVKSQAVDVPHALYYSDYRSVNGLLVPFHVEEFISNQKVWSIQLNAIDFNVGLTDADFQLN